MKKNALLTLTGPSGIGKGYMKNALKERFEMDVLPVYTTRKRRADEKDSCDRIFLTEDEFSEKLKAKKIVMSNEIHSYNYGFDADILDNINNKRLIAEVYVDNIKPFRKMFPSTVSIAMITDSTDFLYDRLSRRGGDRDSIASRVQNAKVEMDKILTMRENFNIVYSVNFLNENSIVEDVTEYLERLQL